MGSKEKFFTREHIGSKSGFSTPENCELVIHCLEFVDNLIINGLDFRFKGGNSLLVLLDEPQRFSIDVDIVCNGSKEEIERNVKCIVDNSRIFTRYEKREPKTKPWLPLISFKIFFNSLYLPENSFIMLDVILEKPAYPGIEKQLKCLDIYESDQMVKLPSVSGLIADKILAIGPSTLGIPIGKNKQAQRLKHVFDVSTLLKNDHIIKDIRSALISCIEQENNIQRRSVKWSDIAVDTIGFCKRPLEFEQNSLSVDQDDPYLREAIEGFEQFKDYIFKKKYDRDEFLSDCERVITLVNKIGSERL